MLRPQHQRFRLQTGSCWSLLLNAEGDGAAPGAAWARGCGHAAGRGSASGHPRDEPLLCQCHPAGCERLGAQLWVCLHWDQQDERLRSGEGAELGEPGAEVLLYLFQALPATLFCKLHLKHWNFPLKNGGSYFSFTSADSLKEAGSEG